MQTTTLSADAWSVVFAHLPLKDMLQIFCTSKYMRQITDLNDAFWQQRVQLCTYESLFAKAEPDLPALLPFMSTMSSSKEQVKHFLYTTHPFHDKYKSQFLQVCKTDSKTIETINDKTDTLLPIVLREAFFRGHVFEVLVQFKNMENESGDLNYSGLGVMQEKCLEECETKKIFSARTQYLSLYCAAKKHYEIGYFSNGHVGMTNKHCGFKGTYASGAILGMRVELPETGDISIKYYEGDRLLHAWTDVATGIAPKDVVYIALNVSNKGQATIVATRHFLIK